MSRKIIDLQGLAEFKRKCDEAYNGGGGGGQPDYQKATPYMVRNYTLDLDEEEFELTDEDATFIFENNPSAIYFEEDDIVAQLNDITNDEVKGDFSRGYRFTMFASDDSIIIYDLYIGKENNEFDFDFKYSEPIGGGGGTGATKGEFDISANNDEWTQVQMEDVYENKYDIVNVLTSSNITVLRKVSEYQGFGVLYWTFMPQQGIVINIFTYDENDGYDIQTQTRMPIVTMEVDGNDVMSQDQTTLKEIYEKEPDILYVDAGNDGAQSYRKQTHANDTISFSCMIGGYMIVVYITEDRNTNPHTYSISIERYDLTSLLVSNP